MTSENPEEQQGREASIRAMVEGWLKTARETLEAQIQEAAKVQERIHINIGTDVGELRRRVQLLEESMADLETRVRRLEQTPDV